MRNWTINEAVKVIREGKDVDAIKEIGSHFPVFAMAAAKNDLSGVAVLMGEKFTLNRLAKEPTDAVGTDDEVPEGEVVDDGTQSGKPLEEMTTKELMKLCDTKGIKVPHYGKSKQFYLDKLRDADGSGSKDEDNGDWEDQADPYEGKTAKELHAMCKERGIKADIKKPAKFYADLLRKADKEEEESGDDWGDEEESAPSGKGGSKGSKKDAKASSDDDWDI